MDQLLGFALKNFGTERWTQALCPSLAANERTRRWHAKWQRAIGSPKVFAEGFANQRNMDARPALSRIRAPTLVLARKNYRWIPMPMSRYVAEGIPGARLIELPGADGLPFWSMSISAPAFTSATSNYATTAASAA